MNESLIPSGSVKGRKLVKCTNCKHRFFETDHLPRMKLNKQAIITALNLYYEGLSVRKVSRQLEELYGEKVSQVSIWKWIQKYSKLVSEYVRTLSPNLSGKWHHDETVIRCDGRNEWFWETIDEESRFLVASHLSETRSLEDTIEIFRKAMETAKQRPKVIFLDGSHTYDKAFNRVFYSRYKVERVEMVKRIGIRSRETNNLVERLHETVKEKLRTTRGFKNHDSAKLILDGYTVYYNYVRPHMSLKGKTPAQASGIEVKGWRQLIENATQTETLQPQANPETRPTIEAVQVVSE
ncbi:MAG: IS6 family transposase [Thaumarchaeota archaeon]|nr:IS6 family transposase [Nitrososphaerota archaeon]MCL5068900.1 IS6 family transposase [Nitrososphaerota archaeon]